MWCVVRATVLYRIPYVVVVYTSIYRTYSITVPFLTLGRIEYALLYTSVLYLELRATRYDSIHFSPYCIYLLVYRCKTVVRVVRSFLRVEANL